MSSWKSSYRERNQDLPIVDGVSRRARCSSASVKEFLDSDRSAIFISRSPKWRTAVQVGLTSPSSQPLQVLEPRSPPDTALILLYVSRIPNGNSRLDPT